MVVSDNTSFGDTTEKPDSIAAPLTLVYDKVLEKIETDDKDFETEVVELPEKEEIVYSDNQISQEVNETEEIRKSDEIEKPDEQVAEDNSVCDEEDIEKSRIDIINETHMIDETIPDNIQNISKNVEIPMTQGIETGLQIQFTSLKLNRFPIAESNISSYLQIEETVNLSNANINIGDFVLYNVGVKIYSYPKFKLVEFKTREFKIALSVGLFEKDTLKKQDDYYKYEIFSKLKNSRLSNVAKIFKKIFSGELITFTINDLKAEISFENRIQYHKFDIIENSVSTYQMISKELKLNKNKNLSEAPISFYTLYLLEQMISGKTQLHSWLNFGIDNNYDIKAGDFISFTNIHKLNMRGINFDLKETVKLKDPITEKELSYVKNRVTCYKKTVTIELEKIEK